MTPKDKILELEMRRKIYNYVLKDPGLHLRELSRKTSIPKSTLVYHLRFLVKRGLIELKSNNIYSRYYGLEKVSLTDKKLLEIFRQDIPRTIILLLILNPNFSQAELIQYVKKWKNHPSKIGIYLDKHQTTISYHFLKLVEMGIIESTPKGNKICYRVKNPELIYDLLINYEKNLINDATGRIVKYFLNNEAVDSVLNSVFDVFPHPYHI